MRITNLLDKNAILLNADISDKNTAINTLIEMHDKAGNLSENTRKESLQERRKALRQSGKGSQYRMQKAAR